MSTTMVTAKTSYFSWLVIFITLHMLDLKHMDLLQSNEKVIFTIKPDKWLKLTKQNKTEMFRGYPPDPL